MKLGNADRQKMAEILDDMTAMERLHSKENSVHFVFDSHTLKINKAASQALIYLARKGLEHENA